ncbi:MAG: cell division protein FtsZ [Sulfurovum sp. PC08-66]|nr:MAG: cell division protein FtsZ [Sulfurovum sp. PC08-66]KIM12383.1 MAG: cell division protein FtsZ [Sulfuricurvum sp. PC08-66]
MATDTPFSIQEHKTQMGAKIKAIGVGGGGSNMINHMIKEGVRGIELYVANTDSQALHASLAPNKIQLGVKLTKGLGAGMKPETGRESALETYDAVREALEGADIVFIAAGLGGGTGTGAAPVIAQIAKEVGALTISVVTKPFAFEGNKRQRFALEGLEALKKESDSIVVIPNERLLSVIDKNMGLKDAFRMVDSVLGSAVMGTAGVILDSGCGDDINVDFADLRTVMSYRGLALMGMGESTGDNAPYEALQAAVESPLLDNLSINGAMGVMVHFQMHPNVAMFALSGAMNDIVRSVVHEDADVIFGTSTNEALPDGKVIVTLVATGFERVLNEPAAGVNNRAYENVQAAQAPKQVKARIVVGATHYENEDTLDIPTYMRQQKD